MGGTKIGKVAGVVGERCCISLFGGIARINQPYGVCNKYLSGPGLHSVLGAPKRVEADALERGDAVIWL